MWSFIMLSVFYSECLLCWLSFCWVSFMLTVFYAYCAKCLWSWVSFMLTVFYAECLLYWVSFMVSVFYAECLKLNVFYAVCLLCCVSLMLCVSYAECILCWASFILSVTIMSIMLNVIMLSAFMLNVVAPFKKPSKGERKLKTSKGIHLKTFYSRRWFWEVVNGSVCHFQSHPTLSNIWREGWSLQDATLRLHALPENIRLGWKWLKLTNTWLQQHGKLL